ncbi:MAG: hypothetical protein KF862_19735 [Chitinophagaceae bacterium]|nr:hypothetical protein [Chitinophagaceae bacterium]
MKSILYRIFLCNVLISAALYSTAQNDNIIRVSPCDDQSIQRLADSLKHVYAADGFQILREAAMTMESEYEIPIIVPMSKGTAYQFVFIGDSKSTGYEVKMYDYNEKQVMVQKKETGKTGSNIISYTYTARMSDYHMIKPVQFNNVQKKNLCGYVMLFKKAEAVVSTRAVAP